MAERERRKGGSESPNRSSMIRVIITTRRHKHDGVLVVEGRP